MKTGCPKHGHLMLELALGLLDDRQAMEAEAICQSCRECSAQWDLQLKGVEAAKLTAAVEQVFADFEPPRRKPVPEWLPLAAAAVLALGVGMVLRSSGQSESDSLPPERTTYLVREAFEADSNEDGVVDLSDLSLSLGDSELSIREAYAPASQSHGLGEIFEGNLETGDLSSWSSHS